MQAVFILVLLGELLALTLVLADSGLWPFDWPQLALVSLHIQWILLASAGILCGLRRWLGRLSLVWAAALAYGLILAVTALVTLLGEALLGGWRGDPALIWQQLLTRLLIAAILAGIALRYLYLQQQLRLQQQAELEARIQALQARIRPHFLFNSMNSIASLIAIDPDRAERVVEDLAELFRATLAEASALVPLADELDLCQRYVAIEQVRLGDRLQVEWHLEGLDDDDRIPRLTLQPLLENAIYHGIQPLPEGGTVTVNLRRQGDSVALTVSNPFQPRARPAKAGNRMALDNIRHRLQIHFGTAADLRVTAEAGEFRVTVTLPVEPEP